MLRDSLGEREEAKVICRRILESRRRVQGERHPKYATSVTVKATYGEKGRTAGAEAVPALVRALEDHEKLRYHVVDALGKIGPDYAPAVPALVPHLDGPHRWRVVIALGKIGPPARIALPAFLEMPWREHGFRRDLMDETLASIRGELGS